jgi:glyceraldehyde-3-phosphate dehydrogenase/erythrose-4-phosphate dehydrogenase
MSIRVGINGFGRIGRLVMRAAQSNPNISIVPVSVEIKFYAIDATLSKPNSLVDFHTGGCQRPVHPGRLHALHAQV